MAGIRIRQYVDRPGLCADQSDAAGGHAGAAGVRKAAPAAAADGRATQAASPTSMSIRSIWRSSARPWPRSSTTTALRSARSCRSTASRWPARPEPRRCSDSASAGTKRNWALRDHALFIAFAPADKPRYAIGCIIEHGGFGASAAAPIVRDSMTYLFDQQKALEALAPLEEAMGRHAGRAQRSSAARGASRPPRSCRPAHDHAPQSSRGRSRGCHGA